MTVWFGVAIWIVAHLHNELWEMSGKKIKNFVC